MKKAFIPILSLIISLFLCSTNAYANTASDDLVLEGRGLLFNNGNPTYSGLLEANERFAAAVAEDPDDPEANLFYAVTRVLTSVLEQGSGAGLETVRDLLEAFGMTRNDNDFNEEGSPFNEPPDIYGHFVPPETSPDGEELRAFFAGPFVSLLDEAISNLGKISSTFGTILTAQETGDTAIEVDYGDVLALKSALYTLKAFILIITAYDLDIDIREIAALGNAGVLQFQRDLLDKYPDLLKLLPTTNISANGAQLLSDAKTDLISGINTYEAAFSFIENEYNNPDDPQHDELFYFETEADINDARYLKKLLADLRYSLENNQPLTVTHTSETWWVNDGEGRTARLEIAKDENGDFINGKYDGFNECWNFIGCGGDIDNFIINGNNVVIETISSDWFNFRIEATLSDPSNFAGTYTASDRFNSWGGNISGTRTHTETDSETIDFNCVFGNAGKDPLDIREVLPQFDEDGQIIAGTFPGDPVFNGIFPDITTEKELLRQIGFNVIYDIPVGTISLDGDSGDWTGIMSVIDDGTDENAPDNGDIKSLSAARDSNYLYWMMELHDPPAENDVLYNMDFSLSNYFNEWATIHYDSQVYKDGSGNHYWLHSHYQGQIDTISDDPSHVGIGDVIEARLPISLFNGTSKVYARTWTDLNGVRDYALNAYLRLPTSSISGTITCSAYNGTGNIFIWAYDGPNPRTAHKLGSTYISEPGPYTITGLPIEANVYLFARWDADGNGVKTFGDVEGDLVDNPILVPEGGVTDIGLTLDDPIDDNDVIVKDGLYRIFGSNSFDTIQCTEGSMMDVYWGSSWELIGEGDRTQTFSTNKCYSAILIIWSGSPVFFFDSFEDLVAGTPFIHDGGYCWTTKGLYNMECFKYTPDGCAAWTGDWPGCSLFTMPGGTTTVDPVSGKGLVKITLLSNLRGDVNGNQEIDLADVIEALKVSSNTSAGAVHLNPRCDVDGDGKIGLHEAIYDLQVISGVNNRSPIRSASLPSGQSFDFSNGMVDPNGQLGDFRYETWNLSGNVVGLAGGRGVSWWTGNGRDFFEDLAENPTYLPPLNEIAWTDSSIAEGSSGKWTRWLKTAEGNYAMIFSVEAASDNFDFDYVYPYGNYTHRINNPPTIQGITVTFNDGSTDTYTPDTTLNVCASIDLFVNAYDPDGDSLTVTWTDSFINFANQYGSYSGEGQEINYIPSSQAVSFSTTTAVSVDDGRGGIAECGISIAQNRTDIPCWECDTIVRPIISRSHAQNVIESYLSTNPENILGKNNDYATIEGPDGYIVVDMGEEGLINIEGNDFFVQWWTSNGNYYDLYATYYVGNSPSGPWYDVTTSRGCDDNDFHYGDLHLVGMDGARYVKIQAKYGGNWALQVRYIESY